MAAESLATGHYARREESHNGCHRLLKGKDAAKDQSYFLFTLSQEQLGSCLFPLGELVKEEVKAIAATKGLPARESGESQDLCFVGKGEYAHMVEARRPDVCRKGDLVDTSGRKLGTHEGIHRFTVGQRRALGIALGEPMYVVRIDAASNSVVLGPRNEALRDSLIAGGVNWTGGPRAEKEMKLHVKIRYNHSAAPATVRLLEGNKVSVVFDEPEFAVTPGQCAVFYDDDEVVGGGWIEGD